MSEKTKLEMDVERMEETKRPSSTIVVVIVLSIAIGALGAYTFKLRQELLTQKFERGQLGKEMVLMKENFKNERESLLNKIDELKKECDSQNPSKSAHQKLLRERPEDVDE